MADLSDITLVIPSYKRQRYALRSLRYWSGKGPQVHLIDGSEQRLCEVDLTGLAGNVHYHHVPASFYERLKKGRDLVHTKYAALLSDDEFFLPSALQACLDELEADPTLVACTGRALAFKLQDGEVVGYPFYMEMAGYSIMSDTASERIIEHMRDYTCSTIYAVVRADVWKRALTLITEKHYPLYAVGELQFEVMTCYAGKSKVIPRLMWLRSLEQQPIRGNEPSLIYENSFNAWWENPEKENERVAFLCHLAEHLQYASDGGTIDFCDLEFAFDGYVKCVDARNAKTLKRQYQNIRGYIIRGIATCLPAKLKDALRPRLLKPVRIPPLDVAATALAQSGCVVNTDELRETVSVVRRFHGGE